MIGQTQQQETENSSGDMFYEYDIAEFGHVILTVELHPSDDGIKEANCTARSTADFERKILHPLILERFEAALQELANDTKETIRIYTSNRDFADFATLINAGYIAERYDRQQDKNWFFKLIHPQE